MSSEYRCLSLSCCCSRYLYVWQYFFLFRVAKIDCLLGAICSVGWLAVAQLLSPLRTECRGNEQPSVGHREYGAVCGHRYRYRGLRSSALHLRLRDTRVTMRCQMKLAARIASQMDTFHSYASSGNENYMLQEMWAALQIFDAPRYVGFMGHERLTSFKNSIFIFGQLFFAAGRTGMDFCIAFFCCLFRSIFWVYD